VVNWITAFEVDKTLLRKSSGWGYERERYPFKPEALTAVILGCRADEDPIFKVIEKRASKGLPQPRLYRAIQHERKYRLIIKSIANVERQLHE
jgi:hypothetical protein